MSLALVVNGESVTWEGDAAPSLAEFVAHRQLRADRVAVERNGAIVSREVWSTTNLLEGDRLEIVHFVGGGIPV